MFFKSSNGNKMLKIYVLISKFCIFSNKKIALYRISLINKEFIGTYLQNKYLDNEILVFSNAVIIETLYCTILCCSYVTLCFSLDVNIFTQIVREKGICLYEKFSY